MNLKQDTVVDINIPGVYEGRGKIKGISYNGVPILGLAYIVEVEDNFIPNDTYPYTHMSVFSNHLKAV